MQAEVLPTHSRKHLTRLESLSINNPVIRFSDIKERLEEQYQADYEYLEKNFAEQNKLLALVRRFQDLERDAKVRKERAARIISVLGADNFKDRDVTRKGVAKDIFFEVSDKPLWEQMYVVVEQVSEIQVVDLQETLEYLTKNKISRQSIESALVTHKEMFETRTRSREKFVSLKR